MQVTDGSIGKTLSHDAHHCNPHSDGDAGLVEYDPAGDYSASLVHQFQPYLADLMEMYPVLPLVNNSVHLLNREGSFQTTVLSPRPSP